MKTRKCKVKFLGAVITPVQFYQLIFNLAAFVFIIWFGQEMFGRFKILKLSYLPKYCCCVDGLAWTNLPLNYTQSTLEKMKPGLY